MNNVESDIKKINLCYMLHVAVRLCIWVTLVQFGYYVASLEMAVWLLLWNLPLLFKYLLTYKEFIFADYLPSLYWRFNEV